MLQFVLQKVCLLLLEPDISCPFCSVVIWQTNKHWKLVFSVFPVCMNLCFVIVYWEDRVFIWPPNYVWCAGLAYLHEECNPPVIHRDIKPTNILLDHNFHAKIANFGPNATHMLTGATGTPGYADPSYNCNSNPGASCDIHSFGVVLLQLVTGKPACDSLRDEAAYYITDWVNADLVVVGVS